MKIGKKFNLLIIGVIVAIFIAIGIFVLFYIPIVEMREDKDSLMLLDSTILELRAEINKLDTSPYFDQVTMIRAVNDRLVEGFAELDEFEGLKSDPVINESLGVIAQLYTLYEGNYIRLNEEVDPIEVQLNDIFLSSLVKLSVVKESAMLKRAKNADAFLSQIDHLYSTMSILDNNLISTHSVVVEQFVIIDKLIDRKEKTSYISGLILVLSVGIIAFLSALVIASRIVKNIRIAGVGIERMSNGNISESFDIRSKDELGELGANLNTLTGSLKSVFQSMKLGSNRGVELKEELITSAEQTSTAAAEIASNSQAISKQFTTLSESVYGASEANQTLKNSLLSLEGNVQEQTAMVEESTSAVTEMISSINNVTDITTKKRAATDNLVKTSEIGGSKLSSTIKVINDINDSLDQIKGAATIIQQIASQTNLLAMNAAIEAAHAGDAGRGFAVVADEIRKLAEASSINSKQINGVLRDVVSRIEIASASGRETEHAFTEIDREVSGVAQSLDEISSSMTELNLGGKQILEAMTGLQDVSINVDQSSNEMTEASGKVTEAIEIVSRITTEVSNSANEITIGITEVSGAMTLVTELSGSLGDITDTLERESACFKTETDELIEGGFEGVETINPVVDPEVEAEAEAETRSDTEMTKLEDSIPEENTVTEVTILGDDSELEIENIEES